ncbi:hypothetical protein J0664_05960 [Rhizobium leguminosarum]|uniref:hypothetical protein n=1 Tax=Rhizobium leguminosarum TaxID=384 RepID=UPI001A9102EF|nr:hypothetical protein [Rhizobium leguminosarum]MBY5553745.1 hypothetical protein [Rhizobium leguminosarum]QSW24843.1 hypothetical protein J0664_05960 [Rhizobium leguminosarum]
MARKIEDQFHNMADAFISSKYTATADPRQRSMGLSYVSAEKQDLISEVAAVVRLAYARGRRDVLEAITYTTEDGGIFNSKLDHVDLREYL